MDSVIYPFLSSLIICGWTIVAFLAGYLYGRNS